MAPANHADKADNLATFLKAGCAQVGMTQVTKKPAGTFLCAEAFGAESGRCSYSPFKSRITPAYPNRLRRRSLKEVKYHDLKKNAFDTMDIIPSLGGMDKVRKNAFRPDEIDSLMKVQAAGPKGPAGPLLTNGYANIFYCIGITEELFAVVVSWNGDEWEVNAFTLAEFGAWMDGNRVFRKH
jgi:hypothetical protein